MKYNFNSWARRMMACVICGVFAAGLSAVPAYRGWQTRTQADGTTIEVQIVGDEFYHYTVNREGKQVREINGMYVEVGEAPTVEVAKTRHKAAKARRMPKVIGTQPNLAPKGVVILANFKDSQMKSSHTQAVFDELCNSENCTVNEYNGKKYGSAAQYFADQSNGTYRPTFDVFGPVNLAKNVADYGTDLWVQDTETGEWYQDQGSDSLAANAVVEACLLANQQYTINWADYDSDSDGYVDFVYLIYAGKGQANGGADETIWPHNWNIESARYYGNCTYTKIQCKVGGKYLNNYACSGELTGNGGLSGIGTLCHEFGHVMGLPDLYDTDYGYNYENFLTPNEWDIMDGGSYNGGEHCPPNYDPWEKYFFGWTDPVNPGNEPADVTLYPNGSTNQNIYQINASGTKQKATSTGLCYYLENRQKSGWDTYLPTHGMVIWKLNFNSSAWKKNEPNNSGTEGSPLYTIVCSSGTMIGDNWVYDESAEKWVQVNDGTNNAFPGKDHVTSWTDVSGKPVTEITESGNLITFKYKGGNTTYWTYGIEGKHCVVPAAGTVDKGEALNLTITADKGYTLANEECWLVEMGSDLLEYGIGFTYNEENGAFAIPSVTGNVYIVAEAAQTEYTIRFIDKGSTVSEQNVLKGQSAEKPADPTVCSNYTFVGWWTAELAENNTEEKSWITDFTATQDQDYYAIYSKTEEGEGESKVASMTFKIALADGNTAYTSASDILNNLISTHDGFKTCSGVKLYEGKEGAKFGNKSSNGSLSLTLLNSASITKVVVNASKYGSDIGDIKVEAGSTSLGTQSPTTNLVFSASTPIETDKITVSTTSKRAYVQSIDIYAGGSSNTTYYSSTVDCSETPTELVDMDCNHSAAKKILRNGQIVIIRGEAVYSITGVRIQ